MKNFLKLMLSALIFVFASTPTYSQEVNLEAAKKLSQFVITNFDSVFVEANSASYVLDYPENGYSVLVSVSKAGDLNTLELSNYKPEVRGYSLLFACQTGNIYNGLYAAKFSSDSRLKESAIFSSMISELNTVTVSALKKQQAEFTKLRNEFQSWLSKSRTGGDYRTVEDLPIWGDMGLMIFFVDDPLLKNKGSIHLINREPLDSPALRKVLSSVRGK